MEPELHRDLISLDFIRDIRIHDRDVSFTIMLTTPACPLKDVLKADSEQAVRRHLPQVGRIDISFHSQVRADRRIMEKLSLPIKNIVAVSSGKGGVGKSTVSVNLAVSLAQDGAIVGLLDADIYGPNVPLLIGLEALPPPQGDKVVPARVHGVEVMSMGFLIPREEALVWRGPMIHASIRQMFTDVLWGELDYLIVDLPPGTGDAQLSVAQLVPLTGGIIVTTPQIVAVSDARRGVTAFRRLKVPVLGVIENMTGEVFGRGGGEAAARELGLDFLGSIAMDPEVARGGDRGLPIVVSRPEGETAQTFRRLARIVAGRVSVLDFQSAG
jgi:ATP-binding protein involved in chromosome partitioning